MTSLLNEKDFLEIQEKLKKAFDKTYGYLNGSNFDYGNYQGVREAGKALGSIAQALLEVDSKIDYIRRTPLRDKDSNPNK